MSTSGSFTPPGTPECAYEPEMTRAAALARRTAGTLDPNCVVVITDGPVIGTPGNTSPTIIELQPVTPTDLGRAALVSTSFDNVAFVGVYDIDSGAAGSLNSITDHWHNTISDEDANAPTVHTQFPFHLSGPNLRDNTINDCGLTGWAAAVAAGAVVTDNNLQESNVDLTGKTSGTFQRNTLNASNLTASTAASFVINNSLTGATISHTGAGAGSFSFQNNTMLTGSVTVDATTTAQVTLNNNVIGGTAGGYRVQVLGKTGNPVIVSGNRLFNVGPNGTYDLRAAGSGVVALTASEIGAGTITFDGPGDVDAAGLNAAGAVITSGPGELDASVVQLYGSTADHLGSGHMTLTNTVMNATVVTTTAPSTRGLSLIDVAALGTSITQSGTGSANVDSFLGGCTFTRGAASLTATGAGTPSSSYDAMQVTSGGQLNAGDHTSGTPAARSRIDSNAILNLSGAGTFTNSRIASSAVLNLTAAATDSVIEGAFSKTPVGANVNRSCTKGFDDWVA